MILFLELYSDSVKWSPPNWNNNQILGKELKEEIEIIWDKLVKFMILPGVAVIRQRLDTLGGSTFRFPGGNKFILDVRIYGVWSGIILQSAPFYLKFYISSNGIRMVVK